MVYQSIRDSRGRNLPWRTPERNGPIERLTRSIACQEAGPLETSPAGEEACMTSTSTDWRGRARKFGPIIQTYSDEAEQSRQMPRPLFEALRDACFFRLSIPPRFRRPEVHMMTFIRIVEDSLAQGPASELGSLYGATLPVLFALPVSAVGLGIARAAIDAFIELAAGKVRLGGSAALTQDGLVQTTVGRAEAKVRSARAF